MEQLLDEVRYLVESLEVQRERLAREAGCTVAQWTTLVEAAQGDTVPRIARRLGLTRQSVQKTADALVTASLARYEPNPNHRRSPLLRATGAGENLRARLESAHQRWRSTLGQELESEDLETTVFLLRALRDDLERA